MTMICKWIVLGECANPQKEDTHCNFHNCKIKEPLMITEIGKKVE